MKRAIAAAAGVLLAAMVANWLVAGPRNLADEPPAGSYRGLSQRAFFLADAAWSRFQGAPSYLTCTRLDGQAAAVRDACWSRKDIQAEGRFYAWTVKLLCPLAGFALYLILARSKPGWKLWRPLTVLPLAVALPFRGPGIEVQAGLVALAMAASLASFSNTKRRENAI